MKELLIPIDMRERYERLQRQLRGSRAQRSYARFQASLVERIAKAEAENAELQERYRVAAEQCQRAATQGDELIHAIADLKGKLERQIQMTEDILEAHRAEQCRAAQLRLALNELIDDEPCQLDHEGFCQTHGISKPCSMVQARKALQA